MLRYELLQKHSNAAVVKSVHLSVAAATHHAAVYGFRPGIDFIVEVPDDDYDRAAKIPLAACRCGECSTSEPERERVYPVGLTRKQMLALVNAAQLATHHAPARVADPLSLATGERELTDVLRLTNVKQRDREQTALPLVTEPAESRDLSGTNST